MSESDGRERTELDTLLGYLRDQGALDQSDLHRLNRFLTTYRASLYDEDWGVIEDQLRWQNEDELAETLESRRAPSAEEILESEIEVLTSRSLLDSEWSIFVGAGGSKPSPTDIPLVSELLPTLWEKATEVNARHLLDLRERCDSLGITNIEELLTAIDVTRSAAANPSIRGLVQDLLVGAGARARGDRRGRIRPPQHLGEPGLVEHLQESTQTLFSLLVGRMRSALPNAFHEALAQRSSGRHRLTVITTNYDICIERALGEYAYAGIGAPSGPTSLLKLHGSLNWFACTSCDKVVAADLNSVQALGDAGLYPVVSQCPACDALAPHLIVPPIGIKLAQHPVLLEIRQLAENALRSAPVVAFVGYSFSESDEYVLRMVSRAVAESNTRILVFDRNEQPCERLRAFLSAHARNYNVGTNVRFVPGNAAETFPLLVEAWEAEAREQAEQHASP